MAYGFYHLASMLLMIYKPFPRFAIRKVQRQLKDTDASNSSNVLRILLIGSPGTSHESRQSHLWCLQMLPSDGSFFNNTLS